MNSENAIIKQSGIKCDNASCDYRDDTVQQDQYESLVNKPCPKCGENLLTEEDFANSQMLMLVAYFMNTLTPEEIEDMAANANLDELKKSDFLKDAKGLEHLTKENTYTSMTIDTHKGIRAVEIKPAS